MLPPHSWEIVYSFISIHFRLNAGDNNNYTTVRSYFQLLKTRFKSIENLIFTLIELCGMFWIRGSNKKFHI